MDLPHPRNCSCDCVSVSLPWPKGPWDFQALELLLPLSGREDVPGPNSLPKPQPLLELLLLCSCRLGRGGEVGGLAMRPSIAHATRRREGGNRPFLFPVFSYQHLSGKAWKFGAGGLCLSPSEVWRGIRWLGQRRDWQTCASVLLPHQCQCS